MAEPRCKKKTARCGNQQKRLRSTKIYGFGVRRLQKSVCASKAMPADDRGVGRSGRKTPLAVVPLKWSPCNVLPLVRATGERLTRSNGLHGADLMGP